MLLHSWGCYTEGAILNPADGYLWITVVVNTSVTIAFTSLVYFYVATRQLLADQNPTWLCSSHPPRRPAHGRVHTWHQHPPQLFMTPADTCRHLPTPAGPLCVCVCVCVCVSMCLCQTA